MWDIRIRCVVLLLVIAQVGCADEPPPPEIIRPVLVMKIADVTGFRGDRFTGRAKATQEINLAFEVPGRLTERPINVGDEVSTEQLLARLDPRDYQNAATAAEARRNEVARDVERIRRLREQNAATEREWTDIQSQLEIAEADVLIQQKALDDTQVRAPFDGVIVATYVENFQNVVAKQPITRLLDLSRIELTIDVPESTISNARYVTGIEVTFDAFRGRPVPATIKEIGREASERTRTYPVTLIMDQPDDIKILPGMAGTVRGTVELPSDQDVFEVPMSALLSDESDKTYVWLIEGESEIKRARRMEVEVAGLSARGARVRGLSPGQLVATAGAASLKQEQQVRVFDESAISAGARRRGGS